MSNIFEKFFKTCPITLFGTDKNLITLNLYFDRCEIQYVLLFIYSYHNTMLLNICIFKVLNWQNHNVHSILVTKLFYLIMRITTSNDDLTFLRSELQVFDEMFARVNRTESRHLFIKLGKNTYYLFFYQVMSILILWFSNISSIFQSLHCHCYN